MLTPRPCGEPGPGSGLGFLDSQTQHIEDKALYILKREKRADTGNNSAGETGMNMFRLGRPQQSVNNESGQERQAVLQQAEPDQIANQNGGTCSCFLGRERVAKG